MAKFLKSLGTMFGFGGQEKPQEYQGTKPYQSLKEIPEGKLYAETLADRLAGRGVGYDPTILNEATNPYASQMRYALNKQIIPQIRSQASAVGLGRSILPVNRAAEETTKTEMSIADKIANLQLANEQQKRAEINAALGGLGEFTSAESGQNTQRSMFDYGEFNRINNARAGIEKENQAGVGRTMTLLAMAAGGAAGGASGAMVGASIGNSLFGSSGGVQGQSSMDIDQLLSLLGGNKATSVNTGVSKISPGSISLPSSGYGLLGG